MQTMGHCVRKSCQIINDDIILQLLLVISVLWAVFSPGDVDVCEAAVELAGRLKESLLPHGAPSYLPVLASVQKVGQAQGRHTLCNQGGDPRCKFKSRKGS